MDDNSQIGNDGDAVRKAYTSLRKNDGSFLTGTSRNLPNDDTVTLGEHRKLKKKHSGGAETQGKIKEKIDKSLDE